jgi:8-oxo-dGTP diphosphatase
MITCKFENEGDAKLRHVSTDAIVLSEEEDKILLVKRAKDSALFGGSYGLPGGFMDRDETLEGSMLREIKEETGYDGKVKELFRIIDKPERRGEDRQNVAFVFVVKVKEKTGEHDDEIESIRWFDLDKIPSQEEMAFDHLESLKLFLENKGKIKKPIIG